MSGLGMTEKGAREALRGLRVPGTETVDAYAAAVWSVVTEPGDGVAGRLVASTGPAEALQRVTTDARALAADSGVPADALETARSRWLPRLDAGSIERVLDLARRTGARLVVRGDAEWPARLDDLGEHSAQALWVRGDLRGLDGTPAVSIVGARASTGYGDHVARELSAGLAAGGVAVVSGAAYGIDGAAHRAALGAGGRTLAFLAGGIDRPYPSGHAQLIDEIARRGAVLSETPCGTVPSKWRFLARNRLIAAMGDATIVVEAGLRSGSLNTAGHAAALGRPLGAVPGAVTNASSAGCHRILREYDGVCVTGVDDARELIGLDAAARVSLGPRTDDLTRVLDAASTRVARDAPELARRAGLTAAEAEAMLGLALLGGDVERVGNGWRRLPNG